MFYRLLLGDFDDKIKDYNKSFDGAPLLLWILFFLSTWTIVIVMLNFLIALISDTYDKVIAIELNSRVYEKLRLI